MSQIAQRFMLDETGVNPDNLVSGEVVQLSDRRFRCVVPKHGPFFVDSIRLYDGETQQPLQKAQYSIPMISQEATLRLGLEVADSLIIEDETVASTVLVTYQAVGGLFQNNIANVVAIFETFLNDNRSIDWVTGVYGKPNAYPPSEHAHAVADLFGFESLTFVFEQIRQAILLGNTPAYEMIFEALTNAKASKADVDTGEINNKLVPLDVLQHAAKYYNFNTFKVTPMVSSLEQDKSLLLKVETTRPLNEVDTIYWRVEHIDTNPTDFISNSGTLQLYRGEGQFSLQATDTPNVADDRKFVVVFYRGGIGKLELFRTFEITLKKNNSFSISILDASVTCCLNAPQLGKHPTVFSTNRGIWGQIQS